MLKVYKPTTPGRRDTSVVVTRDLAPNKPLKSLTKYIKSKAGRSFGQVTVRHQGGGVKRTYRVIDFRQQIFDIPAKVLSIEYDPNRSCWIALISYTNGIKTYVIAPDSLKAGDKIIFSKSKLDVNIGNRMPLKYIPDGYMIHNVELFPGQGGKIVRSAGTGAMVMVHENGMVQLKLPSKEIRIVSEDCCASIGVISNPERKHVRWGKAGRMRKRGIRPSVRGKAMNPCDHPHGGGEARNPIGLVHPKTPWGKPALGVKTRKKHKSSNKFIIKRRR